MFTLFIRCTNGAMICAFLFSVYRNSIHRLLKAVNGKPIAPWTIRLHSQELPGWLAMPSVKMLTLQELTQLLAANTSKPDGTPSTITYSDNSDSEFDNMSVTSQTETASSPEGNVDLGAFSSVQPPVDKSMRKKNLNGEYIDMAKLIFSSDST